MIVQLGSRGHFLLIPLQQSTLASPFMLFNRSKSVSLMKLSYITLEPINILNFIISVTIKTI